MNRLGILLIVAVFVAGLSVLPLVPDQLVDAGSRKKIHFTETFTSSPDPGLDHGDHHLTIILPPNTGTIFDGSMTFTSNKPVQVFVLHEISPHDVKGQPVWTVDGEVIYGLSLVGLAESGSFEFTGAALGLRSPDFEEFTATASVDGWIRGQPTELVVQKLELEEKEQYLPLSRTSVPVTIPMHGGLHEGSPVFYIVTDASDQEFAKRISEMQGWHVEFAAPLGVAPENALQKIFVFTNGIGGDGLYGYQNEVFSSSPAGDQYSALNMVVEATWKRGQNELVFKSAQEIIEAEEAGRIELDETGIVVNAPHVSWPGGQMAIRADPVTPNEMEYDGGQVVEIDTEEMKVTFVAHRGWGPDGRTTYHIVTDATPSGPADLMGIAHSASADLITSPAASDLFHFKDGIRGSGPLGFQAGIAGSAAGDENYTPMWRIYVVEWNNPETAVVLETRQDIDFFKEKELISVSLARPMNSEHVVNAPLIDPFQ